MLSLLRLSTALCDSLRLLLFSFANITCFSAAERCFVSAPRDPDEEDALSGLSSLSSLAVLPRLVEVVEEALVVEDERVPRPDPGPPAPEGGGCCDKTVFVVVGNEDDKGVIPPPP
ncbi:hypothetical protein FB446DRAFT_754828 [Lentinula raphanica]|nr:hypothetical protein FB446DRAFT_754828 [Lentinula raphanica]